MADDPKSLLQMAGAPLHPSPLAGAAVVVIDAQREYLDGGLPLPGIGSAVAALDALLERARRSGAPIFHVVHHSRPGAALFDPEGPRAAIIPAVAPREGERTIVKALPNAFAKTDLDALLRDTGRKEIVVAGFMTHMCVSATVRAALDLGYRSTVVAAATATRDLPDPLGGVVSAAALQRAALSELADRFAIVVPDAAALAD